MENATKALLISAGILIGIIILSIAVYLYGGISSYMSRTQDEIENLKEKREKGGRKFCITPKK